MVSSVLCPGGIRARASESTPSSIDCCATERSTDSATDPLIAQTYVDGDDGSDYGSDEA